MSTWGLGGSCLAASKVLLGTVRAVGWGRVARASSGSSSNQQAEPTAVPWRLEGLYHVPFLNYICARAVAEQPGRASLPPGTSSHAGERDQPWLEPTCCSTISLRGLRVQLGTSRPLGPRASGQWLWAPWLGRGLTCPSRPVCKPRPRRELQEATEGPCLLEQAAVSVQPRGAPFRTQHVPGASVHGHSSCQGL